MIQFDLFYKYEWLQNLHLSLYETIKEIQLNRELENINVGNQLC